jgi:hypothetical protein
VKRSLFALTCASLAAGLGVAGYFVGHARADGIPSTAAMTYGGTLTDLNGTPLTGSQNLQLTFWDAATAGNQKCTAGPTATALVAGTFQLALPDACTAAVHASPDLWVELFVNGASLGRTKLGAVPFAVEAAHASVATSAAQVPCSATDMIDTGAGFCIDTTDQSESAYASSLATCATAGKVVCSLTQLCTAYIRGVGSLSTTAPYRVSDLMFFMGDNTAYFGGGGGGNGLHLPTACGILTPGPHGGVLSFRCCREKG